MTTIQTTISAHAAKTISVMIGLKKNMTGKKTSNVVESKTVPKSCPIRKVRIFHIWLNVVRDLAGLRALEEIDRKIQELCRTCRWRA